MIPWGTSALWLVGTGLLVQVLAERWTHDRFLVRFLWGCLTVRAALSVTLYLASAHHWPLLPVLQLGGGFWRFAPDAVGHHEEFVKVVQAWAHGINLYETGQYGLHAAIIPALYWLLGAHPLHGILLNATLGVASALLAAGITRQLGGSRRATRIAAIFVGLWPSLIWWATQLLKEQLVVFLALLALLAIIGLAEVATRPVPARGMALIRWGMWALFTNFLLAATRPDYAVALALAATLGFGVWGLRQLLARRRLRTVCMVGLVAIGMWQAIAWGREVRPYRLLFPGPADEQFDAAIERLRANDRVGAEQQFREAVQATPQLASAYEELLLLYERDGRMSPILERFGPMLKAAKAVEEERRRAATSDGREPITQGKTVEAAAIERFVTTLSREDRLDELAAVLPPVPERAKGTLVRPSVQDEADSRGARDWSPRTRWRSGWMERFAAIPKRLTRSRQDQWAAFGHSTVNPWVDLSSYPKILAYLPRGLSYVWLAPFPWQATETGGGTGVLKSFAVVESCVVYGLLPFALIGVWRLIRTGSVGGLLLLTYLGLGSIGLAFTMFNLGTLFRLRVPFFVVLPVLASLSRR